jgi:cell division septation protein DedD
MASSRKSGAGERVLEGRHVIGLFFLMLLFSGVFFTLGYVMGRNQLEGQARAATTHGADSLLPTKPDSALQSSKNPMTGPGASDPASDANPSPATSEWEFYRAGEKNSSNDHLKSPATSSNSAQPKTVATSARGNVLAAARSVAATQNIPRGAYLLQVAALRMESEANAIANDLRKKKFPAFVQKPQGDKYYRVQVGPYTDQKAMQTAKKGLETAGFKAIVKH